MRLSPAHQAIMAAPWRQRRNDASAWSLLWLALLATLALAPTAIALWFATGALAMMIAAVSAVLLLQVLWLIQLASLRRQNHPNAARLVPGHVQRLRECGVALFLVLALAAAALLGSVYGHALAWGLAAGASMLALAVLQRRPLLWVLVSFTPWLFVTLSRSAAWQATQPLIVAFYEQQPLLLATVGVLVLPGLASRLIHDGGGAHAAGYAQSERMRRAMQKASRGESSLREQGRAGWVLGQLFLFLYRRWRQHLIDSARPTPRSVMARAELALSVNGHWTAQLGSLIIFAGVGLLIWAFAALVYDLDRVDWQALANGGWGMVIGLSSLALNPVLGARNGLYNSRREQALLMLLPGMPRGAALNQRLARRQMLHFLAAWLVAASLAWLLLGQSRMAPAVAGWSLACLPAGLLLWRDWSRLPPPNGNTMALPALALMLAAVALGTAMHVFALPLGPMFVAMALLTALVGIWRWRRLAGYPQALPAGRGV